LCKKVVRCLCAFLHCAASILLNQNTRHKDTKGTRKKWSPSKSKQKWKRGSLAFQPTLKFGFWGLDGKITLLASRPESSSIKNAQHKDTKGTHEQWYRRNPTTKIRKETLLFNLNPKVWGLGFRRKKYPPPRPESSSIKMLGTRTPGGDTDSGPVENQTTKK
jgi:hypothetical protein